MNFFDTWLTKLSVEFVFLLDLENRTIITQEAIVWQRLTKNIWPFFLSFPVFLPKLDTPLVFLNLLTHIASRSWLGCGSMSWDNLKGIPLVFSCLITEISNAIFHYQITITSFMLRHKYSTILSSRTYSKSHL